MSKAGESPSTKAYGEWLSRNDYKDTRQRKLAFEYGWRAQEAEIEALRKDQEKASDKPLTDIGWTVSELRKTDPHAEPKMARMFMIKAARLLVETEARALAAEARVVEAAIADQIIGQIEDRFLNWEAYRDLIDCIDCTLNDLREFGR